MAGGVDIIVYLYRGVNNTIIYRGFRVIVAGYVLL